MVWRIHTKGRDNLREITSWCRQHMGRSHGEISDWWVGYDNVKFTIPDFFAPGAPMTQNVVVKYETVFIRNRRFAMLALLKWG